MKADKVFGIILFSMALLLLAGFPSFAAKDSLTIALNTKFPTLDNYQSSQRENIVLGYLVFDPLIERNPDDGSLHPHLATSWKIINPTTWEFKLKSGVKFHNGNPLNAECVRFTIEDRILNPAQKSRQRGNFKWVKKVQLVDELTFRIITQKSYPLVLERLNTLFIYDPIWTKSKGDRYVSEHMMGTGPYKFVSWKRGIKLTLVANENYWKKGVPKIKNITIRPIPEMSTRIAELLSDGVDLAVNIDPDQVDIIKKNANTKIIENPILRINFWQFDGSGRASKTPLMDVRVRKAIWHAIDREAIIKNVLKGHADILNTPVSPMQFGYDPSIKGYEYSPQKARALLKEAGYEKGFDLDIWQFWVTQNESNQATMGYLGEVGIKLHVKDYRGNVGQMITLRNAGKMTGIGNFSWGSFNIFDADAVLPTWFLSDSPNCYNPDPQVGKWLLEARGILDQEKRKKLYSMAQRRIFEQAYVMPFYSMHYIIGANKKLKIKVGPDEVPRFQHAEWSK
jgi:peptide/nickel transport system substrate-binding protein